jgi:hypothetical protein
MARQTDKATLPLSCLYFPKISKKRQVPFSRIASTLVVIYVFGQDILYSGRDQPVFFQQLQQAAGWDSTFFTEEAPYSEAPASSKIPLSEMPLSLAPHSEAVT